MLTRRAFLQRLGAIASAAAVAPLLLAPKVPGWEDLPETADASEVQRFEDEAESRWTQLSKGGDEFLSDLVVDDGAMFRANDAVLVPRTGEIMRVVQIVGNTPRVARGTAGSNPYALFDNDWLLRL